MRLPPMPVSIKCAKRIQLATAAVHYASRFMNIQYLIRGFLSPRDAYSPFPPPPTPLLSVSYNMAALLWKNPVEI